MASSEQPGIPAPAARDLLPGDPASWVLTFAAVTLTYLLAAGDFMHVAAGVQVPLAVGIVGGLIAATAVQSALVTGVTATLLAAGLPPAGAGGYAWWAVGTVLASGVAFGVAELRSRAGDPARVELLVATALIALVIAALWLPLSPMGAPGTYVALRADTVRAEPVPGHYVNDDALYRRVFYLMHDGVPYYQSFQNAWEGLQTKSPLPQSVPSYRLPTMYRLWRLLPRDAFAIVPLYLAFVILGCLAAAVIVTLLVGVRYAPLAPLALAAYAMGSAASVYVTYIDLPSACIALVGIAFLVAAQVRRRPGLLWAAAAVLLAAALTREILAYVLAMALVSAAFACKGERRTYAAPFAVALMLFALGYLAHAWAVVTKIGPRTGTITYDKGSPHFVYDALVRFGDYTTGKGAVLPLLFLFAVIGAAFAARRGGRALGVCLALVLLGPVAVMFKVGNPGIEASGAQVNYWGLLFMPFALALWPVAALAAEPRRATTGCAPDVAGALASDPTESAEIPATQ